MRCAAAWMRRCSPTGPPAGTAQGLVEGVQVGIDIDQALGRAFGQPARASRPLAERVRGALGLLRRQALALALQGLTLLAAVAAG